MLEPARKPKLLVDYAPPDYLIEAVELDVTLDPTDTRVAAKLKVRPNPKTAIGGRPLVLDGEELLLKSLALNGTRLAPGDYSVTDTALTIPSVPAEPFTLEIVTSCNPDANTALSGLYRSRGTYCTQCEPEGFRRITYFIDRPDVLAVYTVRIEADRAEAPVLLSNGNPLAQGDVPGTGRHFAIWHDPFPKPSYLFALVGGDLARVPDSFVTASGRKVDLAIYVEPGKEDRCAWAMESLKRAMRWDEERFGREYDLDVFNIVAVSDFNMGAMENKGLNIFNDKLVLARPDTASDADYAAIEGVIAHEYFHNWTGDRVTCRDWFQLCLKEGLTVFRDQEFTADTRSGPVERIAAVRMLKTHQFPEDAGPLAHPVRPASYIEINNFYTPTVYEKGAELCRMLQTLLGRDGFRQGLDLYFERHDGQAVTVEDFVAAMADASGRDLSQFMLWYTQSGTPELACSLDYDARAKTAQLSVSQVVPSTPGQTKKEPMLIPLKLGLIGANGDELPLKLDGVAATDGLIEVTGREQVFTFRDVPSPPTPSLLRGFSAPVRITTGLDPDRIEFLMTHDSDPFNRWQAAQTYATNLLTAAARNGDELGPCRGRRGGAACASPRRHGKRRKPASCLSRRVPQASERIGYRARACPQRRHRRGAPCPRDVARDDRQRHTRDARRALPELSAERALFAGPRKCGLESPAQRRARSPGRHWRRYRGRARRTPLQRGDKHDRCHCGSVHSLPCAGCGARRRARTFLSTLAGRASGAGQMVRGAGTGRAPGFGRDRASPPLASQILAEESQSHPRADRKLRPCQSDGLQPRRRGRIPASCRSGARDRQLQPAGGRQAFGRL